ncbi:MAG: Gfo/Idh/MocA family oxidoreductase [Crocinitomicaceae bacterium]|nr:Gfo/Idh/MocA family oxidoreductase [Crocinitomicaceae bacterium]
MKVLIVGFGSIARKHVNALSELEQDLSVYALRSSTDFEPISGVESITSTEQIPDDIEFIVVSNPSNKHFETIESLAQLGKNMFIEKPSIHRLDGANALINRVKEYDIKTYVACNLRFLDCLKFLKQQISLNQIGRINEVNIYAGSYLPDWRPNQDFKNTYSALSELGGGVHLDLIHEIDYTYWMFGIPNQQRLLHTSNSSLEIQSTTYANYLYQYQQFCVNVVLNYYRRPAKRSIEIITENAVIEVDLLKNCVKSNGAILFESDQKIIDTYKSQMEFFLKHHKTKDYKFDNSLENSIEVIKMCLND